MANGDEQLSADDVERALLAQPRRARLHRRARSTGSTSRAPTTRSSTPPGRTSTSSTAPSGRSRSARSAWRRPGSSRAACSRSRRRATTTAAASSTRRSRRSSARPSTRCNAAVIPGAARARCGDVFALDPAGAAIAYLDPPYAPPRDDTCYVKRYHFLEGLATYWRGQEIMWETRTRKLRKRHTPFGSKRTVAVRAGPAVRALPRRRRRWSSPTAPTPTSTPTELEALLARHRRSVRRIEIPAPLRVRHAPRRGAAASPPSTCSSPTGEPRGLYSGRCRRW